MRRKLCMRNNWKNYSKANLAPGYWLVNDQFFKLSSLLPLARQRKNSEKISEKFVVYNESDIIQSIMPWGVAQIFRYASCKMKEIFALRKLIFHKDFFLQWKNLLISFQEGIRLPFKIFIEDPLDWKKKSFLLWRQSSKFRGSTNLSEFKWERFFKKFLRLKSHFDEKILPENVFSFLVTC